MFTICVAYWCGLFFGMSVERDIILFADDISWLVVIGPSCQEGDVLSGSGWVKWAHKRPFEVAESFRGGWAG